MRSDPEDSETCRGIALAKESTSLIIFVLIKRMLFESFPALEITCMQSLNSWNSVVLIKSVSPFC